MTSHLASGSPGYRGEPLGSHRDRPATPPAPYSEDKKRKRKRKNTSGGKRKGKENPGKSSPGKESEKSETKGRRGRDSTVQQSSTLAAILARSSRVGLRQPNEASPASSYPYLSDNPEPISNYRTYVHDVSIHLPNGIGMCINGKPPPTIKEKLHSEFRCKISLDRLYILEMCEFLFFFSLQTLL